MVWCVIHHATCTTHCQVNKRWAKKINRFSFFFLRGGKRVDVYVHSIFDGIRAVISIIIAFDVDERHVVCAALLQCLSDNALCMRRTLTLPQIGCAHFHEVILESIGHRTQSDQQQKEKKEMEKWRKKIMIKKHGKLVGRSFAAHLHRANTRSKSI